MASVGGELLHFQWHAAQENLSQKHQHCCVFHPRDDKQTDQSDPSKVPESDRCEFQASLYQPIETADCVTFDSGLDSAELFYEFPVIEFSADVQVVYLGRAPPLFAA